MFQRPTTLPVGATTRTTRASDASGEVLRYGSRYELFLLPALCLAITVASLVSAFQRAGRQEDSPTTARTVFERIVWGGFVTALISDAAFVYMIVMILGGHGYGI